MDVFKFLDEAVRGAVSFVYGFIKSTLTMILHPIAGPARLWRASRNPSLNQISPVTYLALALVVGGLLSRGMGAIEDEAPGESALADVTRFLATGSMSSGLVPLLAGAVVGTIVVDALLRLVALSHLSGRRRDRFVAVLEYQAGLFQLVGITPMLLIIDYLGEDAGIYVAVAPFYGSAIIMALHFYALLMRKPLGYRLPKVIPKRLASLWRAAATNWKSYVVDSIIRPWHNLRALGIAYLWIIGGMLSTFPPLIVAVAGITSRELTSLWLREHQAPVAGVTLIDLRCDLAGSPMRARALAWNGSARPASGWLGHVSLEIIGDIGERPHPLQWRPGFSDRRRRDLLLPGESVELVGPILGPSALRLLREDPQLERKCRAVDRSRPVRITSEGNHVRLPGPAR